MIALWCRFFGLGIYKPDTYGLKSDRDKGNILKNWG